LLLNTHTGWVFKHTAEAGYVKGPLKNITYIMAGAYIFTTLLFAIFNRKYMAKRVFITFMVYPIIAFAIIAVQFIFPRILLTGIATFSAVLVSYITIQSDMLEFDLATGLFTEHKLQKHLTLKKNKGVFYIFSVDNMTFIQNHLTSYQLNNVLLKIARKLQKELGVFVYHPTTNRFCAVVKSFDELTPKIPEIQHFFQELNEDRVLELPVPMEIYQAAMEFDEGEKNYNSIMEIINNLLLRAKSTGDKSLLTCNENVLRDLEYKKFIFDILKRELNLSSKQFQVYYQPIYSLKENRFVYMEALSRLRDTERGHISPVDFVEVAESKGLIEQLGDVAFEKVCKFICDNKDVVNAVSINFSVNQIAAPNIVKKIMNTIERFNLAPSNIIIELTESVFIENFEPIFKNITELSQKGVKFYLDDFGTGYSNLANVIALPFSTVKMDRSLVLMMEESSRNVNLVSNLISTFKGANLQILVEGVETEVQNNLVKSAGADFIQGFLYSRPLPANECLELLRK
jgi:EAL domain-containing protein (putative c-di-GMP-specific phosphodiesterase class I)